MEVHLKPHDISEENISDRYKIYVLWWGSRLSAHPQDSIFDPMILKNSE